MRGQHLPHAPLSGCGCDSLGRPFSRGQGPFVIAAMLIRSLRARKMNDPVPDGGSALRGMMFIPDELKIANTVF